MAVESKYDFFDKNFKIQIVHVPTGNSISLYSFLTSFNDSYKTNFKSTSVYGRMDPIVNYQNTTRTITAAFVVPSPSVEIAEENLIRLKSLALFQYPSYLTKANVAGLASPPICKVRFNNLINEAGGFLYGFFAGFDFSPNNEAGYFTEGSNIFPKEYKVSLTFTVLHTNKNSIGWILKEKQKDSAGVIGDGVEQEDGNQINGGVGSKILA